MIDVVDLACQIINMQKLIDHQEKEIKRLEWYESEYNRQLDKGLKENYDLAGTILTKLMEKIEP